MPRTQQIVANALLAEALAAAGRYGEAREPALAALNEAHRLGLAETTMRSAAVLLGLPPEARPEDEARIRELGREALALYVGSAPEQDRAAVRGRDDVRAWARAIEGEEIGTIDTPESGVNGPARERGG